MGLCYVMSEVFFQFLTGACTDGRMSVNDTSRSKFSKLFFGQKICLNISWFSSVTLLLHKHRLD